MGLCFSSEYDTKSDPRSGNASRSTSDMSKSSRKVSSATEPSTFQTTGEILESSDLKTFCFNELKEATRDLSPDAVIGRGNFGFVFKGWIDMYSLRASRPETGTCIAVKMLNRNGCQGQEEWLAEIKYMGRLCHPNLVKLIGYCLEDDYRLLVYEFMPNGSLENYLFNSEQLILSSVNLVTQDPRVSYDLKYVFVGAGDSHFQTLSWNLLMKVALGAAKCLAFLHNQVDVIYRDFKTSNILLDANYNAKLSDFGLARDGPVGSRSHVSTRVLGAEGYVAPEYVRTGHLTKKVDVYGFGIVLLEMISGRRAVDRDKPSEEQYLGNWARSFSGRRVSQVLNPAISGQSITSNVIKVAQLALQCVLLDPKSRPNMEDVVKILEEVQVLDLNNNEGCRGRNHTKSKNGTKYGSRKRS